MEVLQDVHQNISIKRISEISMNIPEMTIAAIVGPLIGSHVGKEQHPLQVRRRTEDNMSECTFLHKMKC